MAGNQAGGELCLLDQASISLIPETEIGEDGLVGADGRIHETNDVGRFIAAALKSPVYFGELVEIVTENYGIDDETARADLAAYLSDLDSSSLISVNQPFLAELSVRMRRFFESAANLLVFRVVPHRARYPERRYRPTARSVVTGCVEAHRVTVLIGLGICALVGLLQAVRDATLGIPVVNTLSLVTLVVLAVYFLGLIGAAVVHELGHFWAARCLRVPMHSVFVRLGASGLVHSAQDPVRCAGVLAAGPLAAVCACAGAAAAAWYAPLGWLGQFGYGTRNLNLVLTISLLFIAAFHLRSLTPLSGEGRRLAGQLLRALAKRRAGRYGSSSHPVGAEGQ